MSTFERAAYQLFRDTCRRAASARGHSVDVVAAGLLQRWLCGHALRYGYTWRGAVILDESQYEGTLGGACAVLADGSVRVDDKHGTMYAPSLLVLYRVKFGQGESIATAVDCVWRIQWHIAQDPERFYQAACSVFGEN